MSERPLELRRGVRPTHRTGLVLATALAITAAVVLGGKLRDNRTRYNNTNFSVYYAWASELRLGQDPWQPPVGGTSRPVAGIANIGISNYPPLFLVLFSPLTRLSPKGAFWLWQAAQIIALLAAILLMLRELSPAPDATVWIVAVSAVFLFPQVYGALYDSDLPCLLLGLVVASWSLDRRGRHIGAGIALAIAALLKMYPAAVGGYFLFRGRWRSVLWTIVAASAGILLTGWQHWIEYSRNGIPHTFDNPIFHKSDHSLAIFGNVYALFAAAYGDRLPPATHMASLMVTGFLNLATIGAAITVTIRSLDVPDDAIAAGLCVGVWLGLALLLSPLDYAEEGVLAVPIFLFAAAGVMRELACEQGVGAPPGFRWGVALITFGLGGLILPFFWGFVRHAHLYFFAMAASFSGACLLLLSMTARQRNRAPQLK